MARTFNRRPVTIDGPDNSDIKNYTFNYEQWKGIDDGKNFLSVDQSTFADAQNMYIDSEGLLSSRPSFKHTSLMNVYADTEVEAIYRLHSEEYAMILCVGKKQYVSGKLVPTVWISYGFNDSCIIAYDSSASYDVKYIDSYDKTYIFINNKYDENPVKLEIFDKNTLSKLSAADVAKSIYVPTTKIFTGNNEEEGEEPNLWTTSEKYLYYYNDVTGISGDAIGKTLTWEGKTLTWSDDYKPHLVKEHYSLPDDAIVTVASTGAVAWVIASVLHYAVNGSEIYSWSLANILSTKYIVSRLRFNNAGNTIFIEVLDTSSSWHSVFPILYMVSCVPTNESNTLRHPSPVNAAEILLSTSNTGIEYYVVAYDYIDDDQWCMYYHSYNTSNAVSTSGICWNFNGAGVVYGDDIIIDSSKVSAEVVAISKNYIVGIGRDITDSYTRYVAGIYKPSSGKSVQRVDTFNLDNNLSGVGSMHYQMCLAIDTANYYAYVPTEVNRTGTPWTVKFGGLRHSLSDSTATYIAADTNSVYELTNTAGVNPHLSPIPYIFFDNYNKVAIDNKILDFTKVDFSKTNPTESGAVISITTLDNNLLPSTVSLYNQIEKTSSSIKILTRFSTDTFELYYDKLGELQLPESITDILYLNNYFFAINNVLYYTENRYNDDGEFLFYLPKKNRNEFDSTINKLHQLSEDTIAIFFTYEIHYAKYDSSLSTYRYYKSKLQFGLLPKGEVITSDDSVTTYFGTSKGGIVALTYQDFVAATEQTTLRISDSVNDNDRFFFTNYPIKILKYRYWIIFYATINRVWVYDTRNQSWWKQTTKSSVGDGVKITQMFSTGANHIYFIADSHLYEINLPSYGVMRTETVYLDYGERPIEWYFKSQKLHLGAPNYFKSIQGMTFFDSSEEDYENIFDLETYAYRDKPYVNGEQNVHYDVRMIRTYLLRMHTMKTNEFQFKIVSDNTIAQDELRHQLKLSSISIRYRITGEVR